MKIDMRKSKREKIRRFLNASNEEYIFDGAGWYKKMKRRPKGGIIEKPIIFYSI
jgi:hypothetical protein